jgi:hypothetical protein
VKPLERTGKAGTLLLGGVAALAVSIGIGRFFYTPLLPIMQRQVGFGSRCGGLIASVNFTGYLVGTLIAALIPKGGTRLIVFRVALIVAVLLAAILFGGAFMAITALVLGLGREAAKGQGFAVLTAGFGVGTDSGPTRGGLSRRGARGRLQRSAARFGRSDSHRSPLSRACGYASASA